MSIHVTVNGNPLSIRRGRMVLSDLDQIKKNERDRRRRLRLEQVRQQSKEISDKLLERAKNIAKNELKKFRTNGAVNSKETYDGKIMEIQQKYQEDMADIGLAHACAASEPDHDAIIQEKEKRNKLMALRRGKEAVKRINEAQKETAQQLHRERLREVRELENLRSTMVARLPQSAIPEEDDAEKVQIDEKKQHKSVKRKAKKLGTKKSPGKATKPYTKFVPCDATTLSPLSKPKPDTVCVNRRNDDSLVPRGQSINSSIAVPLVSKPTLPAEKNSERIARVHESKRIEDSERIARVHESKRNEDSERIARVHESKHNEKNFERIPRVHESKHNDKNFERIPRVHESKHNEKHSEKVVPVSNVVSVEADQSQRYNPEDYVQLSSDSTATANGDSSNLFSDDSSYFSDNSEQIKNIRKSKPVKCPANSKVQFYDHSKHQSKTYDTPVDVVEKIHAWNEPSATDLAQEIRQAETSETRVPVNCKCSALKRDENAATREKVRAEDAATREKARAEDAATREKVRAEDTTTREKVRAEDAVIREKVRRDYQVLLQNLDQLASEERKLKASQAESYPEDVHIQENRRRALRDQHQKKLNRAMKTLINKECPECLYPVERQITITPRKTNEDEEIHVVWDDAMRPEECAESSKNKESEKSREEQILNMLKKVEKQRELLLKEFGADLPNDIFNATTKPLFEKEGSVQEKTTLSQDARPQHPLSPEIRVISAPHDETSRSQIETRDLSVEKVEIAIQTVTREKRSSSEDKSVQVELTKKKDNESNSVSNATETTVKHHPIEPKITIITTKPDSSESSNSTVTNTATNTDKQNARTASKKKKRPVKNFLQVPSRRFGRSYSSQGSKTPSVTRKVSKTSLRPCHSKQKTDDSTTDTPSKRIKIYVNKSGFNIKVSPPQTADAAVDVNTQSSRMYSTDTEKGSTNKVYYESQLKRFKMKDISDSSTSFASPPPARPKNILEALNNNISILEMLDSSASESMRCLRRDVSPVSTPETPSPRTMRMPSNVPRPDKINKMLKFACTETRVNDSSILSSSKSEYSPSTDLSDYQRTEHVSADDAATCSKGSFRPRESCSCKNPECKLMHAKLNIMSDSSLRNCPQILQKYQDLQAICTERIVSLTNLIEKVRNEQKGVELSGFSVDDETSLMQLPPSKPKANDLQSVRQLVENIQAIHDHLAKTLIESQIIIKDKAVVREGSEANKETEVITLTSESTSKNVTHSADSKPKVANGKAKPKIIKEERVNIQVDGFKIRHRPQLTSERDAWLSSKFHDEEMIEKLSKEILEQSKSIGNNVATKEVDRTSEPATNRAIPMLTNTGDFKDDAAAKRPCTKESKRVKDFVPLLADIPKVSRTVENVTPCNGRSKPPVSLLSGPYRTEIESSGHELSTIIEFDTPDTLSKSQNVRSPTVIKRTAETQVTKSSVTVKPSERVAPSIYKPDKSFDLSTSKLSSTGATKKVEESARIPKDAECRTAVKTKDERKRCCVREPNNKSLQCDTGNNTESLPVKESQPVSPTSTDPNKRIESNRDRITSTSSNSFSGLSGISQIASTPSSDVLKYASSPEEMEIALKKLGLGWAITTLKKTREASALSSSTNSDDRTPIGTAKRMISPSRKQFDSNYCLPDFSDVSSISIKEASKSTEQAVLLKGRTSTPKLQYSNSNSARVNSSNTNVSENLQEPSDALIIPDISLNKGKAGCRRTENR